ncbi:MAG: hypothetical protein KDB65_07750 [Calditrichaeota bacterium]|nr:hypothetical protein [Calditrichota bacterium]MCB9369364.1 hypothetical protein [Calditrichota bacterium]
MRLLAHEAWANHTLLKALEKETSVAQRARNAFAHICAAPELWMRRINGETIPLEAWWPIYDAEKLPEIIEKGAREWSKYLNALPDPVTEHMVEVISIKGEPITFRATDILTQFHNHSCHHRGQIAVMFRSAGLEPIVTDFIVWARTVENG